MLRVLGNLEHAIITLVIINSNVTVVGSCFRAAYSYNQY